MITILATLYVLTVAWIAVYGLLGLLTLALYWRHRHDTFPCPAVSDEQLPHVTIQLPIFNERFVVERLIETAVFFARTQNWPVLEVGTPSLPRWQRTVDFYRRQGFREIGPRLELEI